MLIWDQFGTIQNLQTSPTCLFPPPPLVIPNTSFYMQPPIPKGQENRPPEAAKFTSNLCNRDSLLQDLYRMTDYICTCSNKDNSPFAPMTDSSSDME